MISYCSNREDVLLWRIFKDREPQCGFYVDVGACDPVGSSLTKWFYDSGWNGINIEPGSYFARFEKDRPGDINLNLAASNTKGSLKFYENSAEVGISTLKLEIHENLQKYTEKRIEREVETDTLENIFARHLNNRIIDFMSIDVEGWEKQVIEGNDWNLYRPRVLVIEATEPFSNKLCHQGWEPILLEANYLYAYFDGINRYYVREEDRSLLDKFIYPVNVLDDYISSELIEAQEQAKRTSDELKKMNAAYEDLVSHCNHIKKHPEALGIKALSKALVRRVNAKVSNHLNKRNHEIEI